MLRKSIICSGDLYKMTLLMLNGHQTSTTITNIISEEKFAGPEQEIEVSANTEDGGLESESEQSDDENYQEVKEEKNESLNSSSDDEDEAGTHGNISLRQGKE